MHLANPVICDENIVATTGVTSVSVGGHTCSLRFIFVAKTTSFGPKIAQAASIHNSVGFQGPAHFLCWPILDHERSFDGSEGALPTLLLRENLMIRSSPLSYSRVMAVNTFGFATTLWWENQGDFTDLQ